MAYQNLWGMPKEILRRALQQQVYLIENKNINLKN